MSKIRELSSFLKPLEIFSLQLFSTNKQNFLNLNLKYPSRGFAIYFICRLTFFLIGTPLTWMSFYKYFQNKNVNDNIVAFIFKAFTVILSPPRTLIAFAEAIIKIQSNYKFLIIFNDFCCLMEDEFKRVVKLRKFKRNLIPRLIQLVMVAMAFVAFRMAEYIKSKNSLPLWRVILMTSTFVINLTTVFMMLYKFCFYVDLIGVCMDNLIENLEFCLLFKFDRKLMLKKLYYMKKSYIYIIEMADELNYFMSWTISIYTTVEFM